MGSTSHWVARYPPLPVEQDTLREKARTGLPQRRCDLKRRLAQAKGVREISFFTAIHARRDVIFKSSRFFPADRTRRLAAPRD